MKVKRHTRSRSASSATRVARTARVTRARRSTRVSKPARAKRPARPVKAPPPQTLDVVTPSPTGSPAHVPLRAIATVESSRIEKPASARSTFGAWALAICVIGVASAMLLVGRPSFEEANDLAFQPERRDVAQQTRPRVGKESAPPQAAREAGAPKPVAPPVHVPPTAFAATTPTPALMALSGPSPALRTVPIEHPEEQPRANGAAAPAVERPAKGSPQVTITGCLVSDGERFRLNDTSGSEAPKSRNWKTGFLRKRPASIAVVDAGEVALRPHLGQRVALTGTLEDRDLRVHSLTRVASCE